MQKQKTHNPVLTSDVFKTRPFVGCKDAAQSFPIIWTNHAMTKTPVLISKVFPSIGLPNFKEEASIDKCLFDVKKEGTYVYNLIKVITTMINNAKLDTTGLVERFQFISTREERERNREKIAEMCKLSSLLNDLSMTIDPQNRDNLTETIQMAEGKIILKLNKDILDSTGKLAFRKGESLIKVIGKVKEKCAAIEVSVPSIDSTNEFKIFSKENIPNKRYSVVFSSDGEEGAWDLATMSMRGDWSSCQRWEGEYPRCLIGSILSKYIGIIYLTSGVMNSPTEKNGNRANLGTKMMRRCIVRYAIDADEKEGQKACLLVEKMYPDLDKDILALFIKALKERSKLPVHYSADLGNRLRHIYVPHEKMREELSDRDMSYQDAPLKSKQDINVFMFSNSKEEVEREVRGFSLNLSLFFARRLEDIYFGRVQVNEETKRTVSNIRMNTQFTQFCDMVVNHMLGVFRAPSSTSFTNSKLYYRTYLREFLLKRKQVLASSQKLLTDLINQNTSRQVDINAFIDYIMSVMIEFTKFEARKMVS